MSGQIWIQTVYEGYQQTTKLSPAGKELCHALIPYNIQAPQELSYQSIYRKQTGKMVGAVPRFPMFHVALHFLQECVCHFRN